MSSGATYLAERQRQKYQKPCHSNHRKKPNTGSRVKRDGSLKDL